MKRKRSLKWTSKLRKRLAITSHGLTSLSLDLRSATDFCRFKSAGRCGKARRNGQKEKMHSQHARAGGAHERANCHVDVSRAPLTTVKAFPVARLRDELAQRLQVLLVLLSLGGRHRSRRLGEKARAQKHTHDDPPPIALPTQLNWSRQPRPFLAFVRLFCHVRHQWCARLNQPLSNVLTCQLRGEFYFNKIANWFDFGYCFCLVTFFVEWECFCNEFGVWARRFLEHDRAANVTTLVGNRLNVTVVFVLGFTLVWRRVSVLDLILGGFWLHWWLIWLFTVELWFELGCLDLLFVICEFVNKKEWKIV